MSIGRKMMSTDNGISFDELLEKKLKNPKFKKEYDELEEEYTLAKEIIELRIKKNLSQKELAEMIGTSQPSIARLESGKYKNVSMSFIRKVAKALDAVPELHLKKAQ
jgi:DNA-binding Xre family transcriptional regulator